MLVVLCNEVPYKSGDLYSKTLAGTGSIREIQYFTSIRKILSTVCKLENKTPFVKHKTLENYHLYSSLTITIDKGRWKSNPLLHNQ